MDFSGIHRVRDGNRSSVIPAHDPNWSKLDQLLWLAAVVKYDDGIALDVVQVGHLFVVSVSSPTASMSWSKATFDSTWRKISDLGAGARVYRDQHVGG